MKGDSQQLLKVAWEVPWESFKEEPENYRLVDLRTGLFVREADVPVCDICPYTDDLPLGSN